MNLLIGFYPAAILLVILIRVLKLNLRKGFRIALISSAVLFLLLAAMENWLHLTFRGQVLDGIILLLPFFIALLIFGVEAPTLSPRFRAFFGLLGIYPLLGLLTLTLFKESLAGFLLVLIVIPMLHIGSDQRVIYSNYEHELRITTGVSNAEIHLLEKKGPFEKTIGFAPYTQIPTRLITDFSMIGDIKTGLTVKFNHPDIAYTLHFQDITSR